MTELDVIKATPEPRTRSSLARDMRAMGLRQGMLLLVHSSMSALGWVNGGPVAVIQALQDVLTQAGTLLMPAHSGGLSDPIYWENPPVPKAWWETVRATMPSFDPHRTPSSGIGRIPELFRTWPDVQRSDHPSFSFSAWGALAEEMTADHPLSFGLGPGSPLDKLYRKDGLVLLLGVDYESNTSFHLAEYGLDWMPRIVQGAPMNVDGERTWQIYEDVDLDGDDFAEIGAAFDRAGFVDTGEIGSAKARLFQQRTAVDFAESWMQTHRARPTDE